MKIKKIVPSPWRCELQEKAPSPESLLQFTAHTDERFGRGEERRRGETMFIKDHMVNQVAEDLLPLFEIGDFHSGTPTRVIIPAALDALQDRGLPARMNLAGLVSKKAKMAWIETIIKIN